MAGKFKVFGEREVMANIRRMEQNVIEDIKDSVEKHIANTVGDAKDLVPVRTHNLQDSLNWKIENDGFYGIAGTNVEYAPYVEFGTSRMGPQPYLLPSYKANSELFKRSLKNIVDRASK